MAKLSRIQCFVTSDRTWDLDMERMVTLLRRQVPGLRLGRSYSDIPASPRPSALRSVVQEWTEQASRLARGRPYRRVAWHLGRKGIALIRRTMSIGVALMLAYFILERYASNEVRTFVYEFLTFSWNFLRSQFNRLTQPWLSMRS
jgi:hypothetical protein